MGRLGNQIHGSIKARDIEIGDGVVIEAGVEITGKSGEADRVVIGDNVYIGRGTRIMAPEFHIGDYTKLHSYSFGHGKHPLRIGRNCWIGGNTVLDSMGGLDIADNVGIGASSQLWTHIQFGDIIEGSRFHGSTYMHVNADAWFVGHCIVSPVAVGERSLALVGSVITRDMLPNHVYGGSPATDLTDKIGPQFEERSREDKAAKLRQLIEQFEAACPEHVGQLHVAEHSTDRPEGKTTFDVSTRTYSRTRTAAEVAFLTEHVPLMKFVPEGIPAFYDPSPPTE